MLDLLTRPTLAASRSPDPLYRKAYALRRLGRYDEALRVADDCLQAIPPQQVQDQAAAARDATRDRLKAATDELEQLVADQLDELRRATSDGLFRVVEILGVFTAIIAILGGDAASLAASSLTWWQRSLLILITGTIAIGFFWLLRTIVSPHPARPNRPGPK